jgi:hypothetical protein
LYVAGGGEELRATFRTGHPAIDSMHTGRLTASNLTNHRARQAFRNSVFNGSTGSTPEPDGTKPSETRFQGFHGENLRARSSHFTVFKGFQWHPVAPDGTRWHTDTQWHPDTQWHLDTQWHPVAHGGTKPSETRSSELGSMGRTS